MSQALPRSTGYSGCGVTRNCQDSGQDRCSTIRLEGNQGTGIPVHLVCTTRLGSGGCRRAWPPSARAVPGGPWALALATRRPYGRRRRGEAVEVRDSPGVGDQGRLREDVFRDILDLVVQQSPTTATWAIYELKNSLSKFTGTRER